MGIAKLARCPHVGTDSDTDTDTDISRIKIKLLKQLDGPVSISILSLLYSLPCVLKMMILPQKYQ